MLAALVAREPVEQPVALVVAHPDDETLAAGGSLHLFRRLLLVHVTDGAPRGLGDAAREGFASPADYAAARAAELDAALALSGADPERVSLDVPDQEATDRVGEVAERLRDLLSARGIRTVLTHSYEGGHPDHDAVALAVSRMEGEVFEFAGYHADAHRHLETSVFLKPSPSGRGLGEGGTADGCAGLADCPHPGPLPEGEGEGEVAVALPFTDLSRKRAMLACFHTQREILSHFNPSVERFRPAPPYDFGRAPHPGRLLYEEWGWMTGEAWRERVRCGA